MTLFHPVRTFFLIACAMMFVVTLICTPTNRCMGAAPPDTDLSLSGGCFLKISKPDMPVNPVLPYGRAIKPMLESLDTIWLAKGALNTRRAHLEVHDFGDGLVHRIGDVAEPVARVGDWLYLKNGSYTVSFFGPVGYMMRIGIEVSAGQIALVGLTADNYDGCSADRRHAFIEGWKPLLINVSGKSNAFELILKPAVIVYSKDRRKACIKQSVGIWREQDTVSVRISSDPEGAEIMIDGRDVGKTNAKLNIPCPSRETINALVVVRKAGYANCVKRVTKDSGDLISCKLSRP